MKKSNIVALGICFVIFAVAGALFSTVITVGEWSTKIEGKAYHCWDIGFGWYWQDMSVHSGAGDSIEPGWTWDRIERIRQNYVLAFFVLWAIFSLVPFYVVLLIHRHLRGPVQ